MQEPRATSEGAVDLDELRDLAQQIHDTDPRLAQDEARTRALAQIRRPHHD